MNIDSGSQILHERADIRNVTTQVAVQRPAHPPMFHCSQVKVLVVDDDPDFRALARRILETAAFEVSEAAAAAECLRHLESYATDLVILDIVLPDMDGIEALAEIKTLYPATRILTVSGADNCELYLRV